MITDCERQRPAVTVTIKTCRMKCRGNEKESVDRQRVKTVPWIFTIPVLIEHVLGVSALAAGTLSTDWKKERALSQVFLNEQDFPSLLLWILLPLQLHRIYFRVFIILCLQWNRLGLQHELAITKQTHIWWFAGQRTSLLHKRKSYPRRLTSLTLHYSDNKYCCATPQTNSRCANLKILGENPSWNIPYVMNSCVHTTRLPTQHSQQGDDHSRLAFF